MQVTTLLGSPKKKGNTATVLGWVAEDLKFHGGHNCGICTQACPVGQKVIRKKRQSSWSQKLSGAQRMLWGV